MVGLLSWEELKERLGLQPGALPNRAREGGASVLRAMLPMAVEAGCQRLASLKAVYERGHSPSWSLRAERLNELRQQHETQLRLNLDRSAEEEGKKEKQRREKQEHIDMVFEDHRNWLCNTQETEEKPYFQIAVIFTVMAAQ